MKNKPITILGIWLAAFSFTIVIHRWVRGLDPEFMFFIWSIVFTGAVAMILTGLGAFQDRDKN